jgi:hypothetical protein
MVNNMYADAYSLERLLHRQKSLNHRISAVIVLIVVTLAIGLVQYSQSLFFSLALFCLSLCLVVIQISTENKIAEILHRMDFSLSQFEDRDTREVVEKKLNKLFGNIPHRITSNAEMARTRGGDEKGPTWGKQDGALGEVANYRDAVEQGKVFEGLEGELSNAEKMLRSADKDYSQMAQQRWETSQRNDPDLIEAGIETLAELVTTDYFEKNPKDGAVDELMGQNSE